MISLSRYNHGFGLSLATAFLLLVFPVSDMADDGAASIAVGGLIPSRETRIVMAKEVLRISQKKVIVDYDFRNDTDDDVATEVAFPVPPYTDDIDEPAIGLESFSDFRLDIDGKVAKFASEAKAIFKGKDVTEILTKNKIDIASFGHFDPSPNGNGPIRDLARLPKGEQKRLIALGLFAPESDEPRGNWTVHLQYHWTQTFPAHATVHIKHEYSPVAGADQVPVGAADSLLETKRTSKRLDKGLSKWDSERVLDHFCPENSLLQTITDRMHQQELSAGSVQKDSPEIGWVRSVDFILTTANTWQRPIEDFTLIIERPPMANGEQTLVSFCSPGPVEKLDADHFQVHLTNFVPKAELHIGFFGLPAAKTAKPK